jgi:hypothetical protein
MAFGRDGVCKGIIASFIVIIFSDVFNQNIKTENDDKLSGGSFDNTVCPFLLLHVFRYAAKNVGYEIHGSR